MPAFEKQDSITYNYIIFFSVILVIFHFIIKGNLLEITLLEVICRLS